ncbi:MAG: Anucleate primary sterigmata protein B [Thelocarpon superellum]|nr:MAG: Anucleate primary sterigmata protein B [Thelocarpon superellum]
MASPPSSPPPPTIRQRAPGNTVPGGFDYHESHEPVQDHNSTTLPPLPPDDSSLLAPASDEGVSRAGDDSMGISEKEMGRKLMDIESSFLPAAPSPLMHSGDEDVLPTPITALGQMGPPPRPRPKPDIPTYAAQPDSLSEERARERSYSPPTPPETYRTPAPPADESPPRARSVNGDETNLTTSTSMLETMSSSPTAAAAARTISRVVSMASVGGYETADDRSPERPSTRSTTEDLLADGERTPRGSRHRGPVGSAAAQEVPEGAPATTRLPLAPPKSLRDRFAAQRASISSLTASSNSSKEGGSDVTLGAEDHVPADGGLAPNTHLNRTHMELSRSTSLGSIVSGITGYEEPGNAWLGRSVSGTSLAGGPVGLGDQGMDRLDEETASADEPDLNPQASPRTLATDPNTPRASGRHLTAPTDTVIAQHVRNIQVPASIAREYRQNNRPGSPDKRAGAGMPTPLHGRGKSLTLKEQSSSIDRLQKENFDLKLKIHYLNQALNERSEEGVKEMISENVELKAGLATMEKQARTLRKTIRDLERAQRERERERDANATDGPAGGERAEESEHVAPEVVQELTEEITFWRERVETYEVEMEHMRREDVAREAEKRRLAEMVKNLGERRGRSMDSEETDMWKELLDGEAARREQADQENRQLREEIARLSHDHAAPAAATTNNHTRNVYVVNKRPPLSGARSYSGESHGVDERHGSASAGSSTAVEQLRHENEELRREVSAQTSMLTSRNREKERLYQEIEDLKLGHRTDGGRSVAGDSILERSASRAHERTPSWASVGTRVTALSDRTRDDYERKNGELRDQLSTLKMANQELELQLDNCMDDLEKADVAKAELERAATSYQDENDLLTADLQTMQAERDEALTLREDLEAEFEALKQEANDEIAALEAALDQKNDEAQRLGAERMHHEETFNALQAEMRAMSEGVVRLEDEQQANRHKAQRQQRELDESSREIEGLEKALREAHSKIERFTVQQESSQSEIAFLREEQDADKMKIGDLESALKKTEANLQDERDRVAELEKRVVDERHQRELVGSKEKQEVQRMMNDLQREASAAKDEARRLRKSLSSREIEATEWKERLTELENNLREALGDLSGTRSSLLTSVTKLQKELEESVTELESTRHTLADKERVLRHRDALLENTGLESRRLSDLLDRERQARKADKYQIETLQRTTQHTSRTLATHETRVKELESARQSDGKKMASLETQFAEKMLERNNLLLSLWHRLSMLCGPDWAHKHTLVNGRLPSVEVVASALPSFSKNLLLAVTTIEALIGSFKNSIRGVERDLWKQYQSLEHELEVRSKKLERLEGLVHGRRSSSGTSTELAKLRGECRVLKAEVNILRKAEGPSRGPPGSIPVRDVSRGATSALSRHNSLTSAVEPYERQHSAGGTAASSATALDDDPTEQRWVHRLRELERRLKAEREARLLDRNGARKRLEEGRAENEELRLELERAKTKIAD